MKNKIMLVVAVLFGLFLINAGLNKFFEYMPMPKEMPKKMMDSFAAFMTLGWLIPLVAIVEIVGGVLCIPARTRALGAIVILPVMVGIVCTNAYADASGLMISIPLLLINLWFIADNYKKYLPMLSI